MENKKKNTGWIVITILLLLVIAGLVLVILNDKGIIKIGNNTKKETTKTETKVEDKEKTENKDEVGNQNIMAPETYNEGMNELGKIKIGKNEYEIKVEKNSENNVYTTYVGDKKLDGMYLQYAVVMGEKFLVVKGKTGENVSQRLYIFDESLKEVEEPNYFIVDYFTVINDDGSTNYTTPSVSGTKKYTKDIIDSNHLIIAECTPARNSNNHNQDYVEKLYSFENGKVEVEELTVVENIFCSAQR